MKYNLKNEPITVEVVRGTMVESRHRVHAVIVNAIGDVIHHWGDPDMAFYPRSAIKPLQALPLLVTGAAEAFNLTDEEVAFAASSHSSAPAHLMALEAWFDRVGLSADNLECGAHLPYDEEAAHAMLRQGETPHRGHNNCSGKHAGFLTTACHLGEDLRGYIQADHPVQQRMYQILSEMGEADLTSTARGIDGCGIPIYGMPLKAMALGMAKLADPSGLKGVTATAAKRVTASMAKHPYMVAGRARFDTVAMQSGKGLFSTKGGAEAAQAAILPSLGLGIALKCEDGAKRAADTAIANILDFLGLLDDRMKADLADFLEMPIVNVGGSHVGTVRMAEGWSF